MKQEIWTKKCKCGNYIPDKYNECRYCLLEKYNLHIKGRHDSCDQIGLGPVLYEEENVIEALRKAEGYNTFHE